MKPKKLTVKEMENVINAYGYLIINAENGSGVQGITKKNYKLNFTGYDPDSVNSPTFHYKSRRISVAHLLAWILINNE